MTPAEIIAIVSEALPKLLVLIETLGSKDAVLEALDATLTVARVKTDADLDRKHHTR